MDPSLVKIPPMKNLTSENITQNVHTINSQAPDQRLKYVLERLVTHLHDFARETRLGSREWMAAIEFLTDTGKICTDERQEFILLSDILGLSLVVDSIDHPKPPNSTDGTLLGPFHVHGAPTLANGDLLSHDPDGEPCLVLCTVKDATGMPIEGVHVDVWETDSKGFYDVQYAGREGFDGRAVLKSDDQGAFWFKAVKPVPYPIPHDGPVGKLLKLLHRHPWRPAHMHFTFKKTGYDHLITALYLRGDPYETSDAVFGVKDSLLFDFKKVSAAEAQQHGAKEGHLCIKFDFVLTSEEESRKLRHQNSVSALKALGMNVKIVDGLPVAAEY